MALRSEAELWHVHNLPSCSWTTLVQTPALRCLRSHWPPNGTGLGLPGLLSAWGVCGGRGEQFLHIHPCLLFLLPTTPFPQLYHGRLQHTGQTYIIAISSRGGPERPSFSSPSPLHTAGLQDFDDNWMRAGEEGGKFHSEGGKT